MHRSLLVVFVAACSLSASNLALASNPTVVGDIQGLELAQQTGAHPALFVGIFSGRVNGRFAIGTWATGVTHELPLPAEIGESIAITGGQWAMDVWTLQGFWLKRVKLSGALSGSLALAEPDLFYVDTTLTVTTGGSGLIALELLLDHTVFPPAVSGSLSQP